MAAAAQTTESPGARSPRDESPPVRRRFARRTSIPRNPCVSGDLRDAGRL